jgi:hypothetical protein
LFLQDTKIAELEEEVRVLRQQLWQMYQTELYYKKLLADKNELLLQQQNEDDNFNLSFLQQSERNRVIALVENFHRRSLRTATQDIWASMDKERAYLSKQALKNLHVYEAALLMIELNK